LQIKDNVRCCIISSVEPAGVQDFHVTGMRPDAEIVLLGATLQLRGLSHVFQPLGDSSGNLLAYNGTLFFSQKNNSTLFYFYALLSST